jgi:hypothetical protein
MQNDVSRSLAARVAAAALLVSLASFGCDGGGGDASSTGTGADANSARDAAPATRPGADQNPADPAAPGAGAAASASRRPTTQQLVDGRTKTVPVSLVPLNIQVPESWELVTIGDIGGLVTLEGWAPHGFVQLRLAARQNVSADTFDGFVKSAENNAKAQGEKLKKFEVRRGDPLTIVERQILGDRQLMPATDDQGNLVDREGTPLRWSYLVFLKNQDKYEGYELWFDALSLEQYEQDAAFLQKIMDSLTYDASRKQ